MTTFSNNLFAHFVPPSLSIHESLRGKRKREYAMADGSHELDTFDRILDGLCEGSADVRHAGAGSACSAADARAWLAMKISAHCGL